MRRFIAVLALLAIMILAGCEKLDSPMSPSQDQQVKTTLTPELQAKTAKLKENVQAWKAEAEARAMALKSKAAVYRQSPLAKSAAAIVTVPDDFPTIQAAVDAAAPGTRIVVENGTYTEEVSVFTDNITIVAEHEGKAHVIGGFGFGGVTKGSVQGFDITGGVFLEVCTKVVVKDNEVKDGFGIILFGSVDCEVKDNEIHDTVDGIIVGPDNIAVYFGEKNLVKDNTVKSSIGGILVYGGIDGEETSGKNVINDNLVTLNQFGIVLVASNDNEFKNNRSNSNLVVGIAFIRSDDNTLGPDNKTNNNGQIGIALVDDSDNNTVRKNQAQGNGFCDAIDAGVGNIFIKNKFGSFNCP